MDQRILKTAKLLTHYCLRIKKGETAILSGSTLAEPWIKAVYAEVLKAGAFPIVRMAFAEQDEIFYQHAQRHHLKTLHPLRLAEANAADAFLYIDSDANTKSLSDVDPTKQALSRVTNKPVSIIIMKKKWNITLFPTQAFAQDAEMSLGDFEDFVYSAMYCDKTDPVAEWQKVRKAQEVMCSRLNKVKQVRIIGPDTDISFSVAGRTFENSYGTHNMPCGEVFTGPVEDSTEGYIRFTYPVCMSGKEVDDVRLEFSKGKVVKASAGKNEEFLMKMLDIDPGARRLGEFGIGNNYGIKKFIKNILFDEKIGGTIHLALGESYPETGGKNKSALHWDMIKDLRRGGEIYLDGKLWQKNGKLLTK